MSTAPPRTPTRDTRSVTRVRVDRPVEGGRAQVMLSATGAGDRPVVRPVLVSSDAQGATVSLVPEGALLLAGDAVSIEISVGPGAFLQLVEPGGTVAYPMFGDSASWDVTIDVAAAGRLVWSAEPFVVAAGARVTRRTSITLGPTAAVALREVLVLGRHGERPGHVEQELVAAGTSGRPLLADGLVVGPDTTSLLLGGSRAMGSVLLLGRALPEDASLPASTRFDLEGGGTLVRRLAPGAHRAVDARTWADARSLARSGAV